jgi:hypothetical protein
MVMTAIRSAANVPDNVTEIHKEWPPTEHDRARVQAYERYQQIFDGDHIRALNDSDDAERYGRYVVCNVGGLIVKSVSDLLFGEELTLEYPDDATTDEQKADVQEIWDRNDMQTMLFEGSLDTGVNGDGVYQVRLVDGLAKPEPVAAVTWFPTLDPSNIRQISSHTIAWKLVFGEGKDEVVYLRKMIHEPGVIRHELWLMENDRLTRKVDLGELEKHSAEVPPESEETGIEEMPIVHVPNFRTSRDFFGRSEFLGMESMFSVLNARLTQPDYILEKNATPTVSMSEDIANYLLKTHGEIDKDRMEWVYNDHDGKPGMSYITWDGRIADNLALVDAIIDKILFVTETAKQLVGKDAGSGPVSGRAMKFALMRTLAKVNRKRMYYNTAIPKLLKWAMEMEGKEAVRVKVNWPDGLPQDALEETEVLARRRDLGTVSKRTMIKRLDDTDDAGADTELEAISDEDDNEAQSLSNVITPTQNRFNVNVRGLEEE